MNTKQSGLKIHPLATQYPLLEGTAFDDLVDSISRLGLLEPISLWHEQIVDGRNRYFACQKAGVEPVFEDCSAIAPENLQEFIEGRNEHRRQLSLLEQKDRRKKRVERLARDRQKGESIRSLALREKISAVQVLRDLRQAKSPTKETAPTTVTGRDQKQYPPKKKTQEPPGPTNTDAMTDALGTAIPRRLRDIFADSMLRTEARHLAHLVTVIQSAANTGFGYLLASEILEHLEFVQRALENAVPYAVHLACKGKGCSSCRGQGYVPQWAYQEMKKQDCWDD